MKHLALIAVVLALAVALPMPISAEPPDRDVRSIVEMDLAGQTNPYGLMLTATGYRRWISALDKGLGIPSSYLQAGLGAATTPAYGRISVHAEWLPAVFAKLRLQYDQYRFYGTNTSLLSFPSGTVPFGKGVLETREGTEQEGNGNRMLVRPILYAKAGPVYITNQTDLAYFHFAAPGPYYLEWTYETLLTDGDRVVENRTNVLYEVGKGSGAVSLLAGPYFEIMESGSAHLKRKRAGLMVYWVPWETIGQYKRPRLFAQVAHYLQDRNRDGEYMALLAIGCDLEL